MASTNSFFTSLNNWLRTSITIKLLVIGFLILILLIPSTLVTELIRERENTRNSAMDEVSSKWGGVQVIGGPVISVPYQTTFKNQAGETVIQTNYAHFLPDKLDITCEIKPEKRYRGIYVVVLYAATLKVTCQFSNLNVNALEVTKESLQFNKSLLTVGITDMKGIRTSPEATINGKTFGFEPGTITNDVFASGMNLPMDLSNWEPLSMDFQLDLNGSTAMYFLPFGKETMVEMKSEWGNPSFDGAFATTENQVTDNGFTANWKVLQVNRNYPQQGTGSYIGSSELSKEAVSIKTDYYYDGYNNPWQQNNSMPFGVRLILPVDEYQKNMRSAKYSTMFIILTFMSFFFIEVLNRKRLHPIQYLLIGGAICLFYVLLLSLSEHVSFNFSYWVGCAIILLLITLYAWAILNNRQLSLLIGSILVIFYGFFYALLQLQDYALLMGSFGLLIILATIMYLTRKIDWFHIQAPAEEKD
jgi:inner membrane protein